MLTLRDYVNWGLTHCDKTASAEGVPLVLEKCVKNKKMKQLEVYGNSIQNGTPSPENPIEVESVGELVTDVNDTNYGKYKIPVTVRGKNLFDCVTSKMLFYSNIKPITLIRTKTDVSYTLNADASSGTVLLDFGLASDYVNKTLTLSFDIELNNSERLGYSQFMSCDADGSNRQEISGTYNIVDGHYYRTTTLGSNYGEKHLALRLYVHNAVAGTTYEFKNIMVAESDTDVPFEPYIEPIKTNVYLNEPLRKIGDYADYIDGKGKKAVRQIKQFTNFAKATVYKYTSFGNTNAYRFSLYDALSDTSKNVQSDKPYVICNLLPYGGYVCRNNKESIGYSEGHLVYFRFEGENDYGITDVSSFRNWYNQANPLLYYILHEPTEETIECELPTLPAKTSIVEIDTALLPSNIKGKYIKK